MFMAKKGEKRSPTVEIYSHVKEMVGNKIFEIIQFYDLLFDIAIFSPADTCVTYTRPAHIIPDVKEKYFRSRRWIMNKIYNNTSVYSHRSPGDA
jgi:hypothetical protein